MKLSVLILAAIALLFRVLPCVGLSELCSAVDVRGVSEIDAGKLSLDEILGAGTCPAVRLAAAAVSLGNAPVTGSARVFTGSEIKSRLQRLLNQKQIEMERQITVPERVTVERTGRRADCLALAQRLFEQFETVDHSTAAAHEGSDIHVQCGGAGRIPQNTDLKISRIAWNPGFHTWDISARCDRAEACVPFLVRIPAGGGIAELLEPKRGDTLTRHSNFSPEHSSTPRHESAETQAMIRRGQPVSICWENRGIRILARAVSLDSGSLGDHVRVRLAGKGSVLSAVVVDRGTLQAIGSTEPK